MACSWFRRADWRDPAFDSYIMFRPENVLSNMLVLYGADSPDRIAMTRNFRSHPHTTYYPHIPWSDSSSPNSRNCDLTRVKGRILDRKILSKSQKWEGCIPPGLAVKGRRSSADFIIPYRVWDDGDDDAAVSNWMPQGPLTTARTRTSSSLSPILPRDWDAPYAAVSNWQRINQC